MQAEAGQCYPTNDGRVQAEQMMHGGSEYQ
jgi:hypothetical protein